MDKTAVNCPKRQYHTSIEDIAYWIFDGVYLITQIN